jgi:hypothetical protein
VAGLGNFNTLQSVMASATGSGPVGTANWGQDLNGAPVTSLATFNAAVAQLRAPAGHNPALAANYAYPPPWAVIDANGAAVIGDTTDYNPAQSGNADNTIAQMSAMLGVRPVAVMHMGCGSFVFSTLDTTSPTYWMVRTGRQQRRGSACACVCADAGAPNAGTLGGLQDFIRSRHMAVEARRHAHRGPQRA